MSLSDRLKHARSQKGLSQSQLAQRVGLHYTQIGRYENKGAQPSADVLAKLAQALEVSTDYLMHGSSDEVAQGIADQDLRRKFQLVAQLPPDQKHIVNQLLDAFLLKHDLQQKLK